MLRILSDKKRNEFYRRKIGKNLRVLFEHEEHNGTMRGFASNYVRVEHPYNSDLVNNLESVKIAGVSNGICTVESEMELQQSISITG